MGRWGLVIRGICSEVGQSADDDVSYERYMRRVYLWDSDFGLRRLRNLRFRISVRKSNRHSDRSSNRVILIYVNSTSSDIDAKQPILATVRNGAYQQNKEGRKRRKKARASTIPVDVTRDANSSKQNAGHHDYRLMVQAVCVCTAY